MTSSTNKNFCNSHARTLYLSLSFLCGSFFIPSMSIGSVDKFSSSRLNIVPQEIFITIYPQTGVINIIEYDLQIANSQSESIDIEVENLKSDVRKGVFSTRRYLFKDSTLGDEKIYLDHKRNLVTGEYWLKTNNKNLELFEDVFEVFLQQDVEVKYSKKKLSAKYSQDGVKAVASQYGRRYRDKTHEMIVWKDGSPNYDAVFSIDRTQLAMKPITTYFTKGERIGSPGVYIDGDNAKTYINSIISMAKGAHPNSAKKFQIALIKISSTLQGDFGTADEARQDLYKLLGKKLDNMSFEEVIALGKTIKPDKKTKKVIKDFKQTGTNRDFQHDADIVRLKHISYLGDLIERFHDKTGNYPLSSDQEKYVYFVSPSQEQYALDNKTFKKDQNPILEFKKELELKLEQDVIIPFDPQLVPVNKPAFYVYRVNESGYTLTAHLFEGKGISNKVKKYHYELNISSKTDKEKSIYTYDEIVSMAKFKKKIDAEFINRAPKNPEQRGLDVNSESK